MTKRHLLLLGLALTGMNSYAAGLAYDFESDSNDWSARGTGETTIELSTEQKHGGEQSLYVDKRSAGWHGALVQNDYIQAGKTYKFSVWVFSKENARIELSLQYTQGEDDSYPAIDSKQVNAYNWTELSGEIVIPEAATDIQPYVQSNENATLSFYIDDFTCEEKVEEIIDYSTQPALKDLFAGYFKVGTAVTASEITPTNAKNMVLHHFNSVTPGNELKPDCLLDQTGSISNGDNVNPQVKMPATTKTVLKFCSENNIPIRGHVFIWHSQTPDWFFNEGFEDNGKTVSKEIMDQRIHNYIKNVVEAVQNEFPNLDIYAWDIVNEVYVDGGNMRDPGSNYKEEGKSRWMEIYGDDSFISTAFESARKLLPRKCKIYYNDYNEYVPAKRDAIYNLVKKLYAKGLCDGTGMQSHLSTDYPSVSLYKEALEKYATIGCDIQITELDITIADGHNYDTQANMYKQLFELYKTHKDEISVVTVWGTNDEISWRKKGRPLLFSGYKPKEAYWQIIEDMPQTRATASKSEPFIGVVPTNVRDLLNIDCAGDFEYQLLTSSGKEVLKGKGTNHVELNLNGISSGMYVVEVGTVNGNRKHIKIIKE